MKKILFTSLFLLAAICLNAQYSLLTVFSDEGEEFYLYVNGKKMNEQAQSRVEFIKLENDYQKIKVVGTGGANITVSKQVPAKDFDGNYCKMTYCLKKNRRGDYKLREYDVTALPKEEVAQRAQPVQTKVVVVEEKPEKKTVTKTEETVSVSVSANNKNSASLNVSADDDKVSLSINVSENTKSENVSVSFSASESSVSGSIQVTESSQETVVIETSSSSSSSNSGETKKVEVVEVVSPLPGYSGKVGCDNLINDSEYDDIAAAIKNNDFEETKFTVAKDIVSKKCIQAKHVHDIMKLFDHEDTRLRFAKFAYTYTYDQDDYYKVYKAFDFELTIDDLKAYIDNGAKESFPQAPEAPAF